MKFFFDLYVDEILTQGSDLDMASLQVGSLFKGTVMQIEKALINDRLRVSKVS